MSTSSFIIGNTYSARSACDHNAVWSFVVVARTAKQVTLRDDDGKEIKRRVIVRDGVEECFPLGKYSMAPRLRA